MAKARSLVGLDVHAPKVVAAILDAETGELRFQRLGGESEPVVKLLSSLAGPVRASYEAGPTGLWAGACA
jgi:transposase